MLLISWNFGQLFSQYHVQNQCFWLLLQSSINIRESIKNRSMMIPCLYIPVLWCYYFLSLSFKISAKTKAWTLWQQFNSNSGTETRNCFFFFSQIGSSIKWDILPLEIFIQTEQTFNLKKDHYKFFHLHIYVGIDFINIPKFATLTWYYWHLSSSC